MLHYHYVKHSLVNGKAITPILSFILNLGTALKIESKESYGFLNRDNKVAIIEDDDWYSNIYFKFLSEALDNYDVVGIDCTTYYHIPTKRYKRLVHPGRSSLNSTAFRFNVVEVFMNALVLAAKQNVCHVDILFWNMVKELKLKYKLFNVDGLVLGLKGLPGKAGLGIGHRDGPLFPGDDRSLEFLASVMGHDIISYMDFLNG
jgi:hypothetical protein